MTFHQLIIKIAKILEKLNIQYAVTGGYAVSVLGRPRATFDIDIVIESVIKIQKKLDWKYIKQSAKEQGTLMVLDKFLDKI